jgi:membrane-associated phospholipid phosphatase
MRPTWRRNQTLLLRLCGGMALLAAGFAAAVGHAGGFGAAQAVSRQLPAAFWESVTVLGDARILLALFLPFCWRYPRLFWAIVLAAAIAGLATRGIKLALPLPRPAAVLAADDIVVVGQRLMRHSMPAGHAATLFAFAGVLFGFAARRLAWTALAVAVLASFSRIAVGAHWPLDVMVGALSGLFSAWLALQLMPRWDWGMRPRPFLFLLALAALAVASLPFDAQGYPGSLPLRTAFCLWGFVGLLAQHVRAPRPCRDG